MRSFSDFKGLAWRRFEDDTVAAAMVDSFCVAFLKYIGTAKEREIIDIIFDQSELDLSAKTDEEDVTLSEEGDLLYDELPLYFDSLDDDSDEGVVKLDTALLNGLSGLAIAIGRPLNYSEQTVSIISDYLKENNEYTSGLRYFHFDEETKQEMQNSCIEIYSIVPQYLSLMCSLSVSEQLEEYYESTSKNTIRT